MQMFLRGLNTSFIMTYNNHRTIRNYWKCLVVLVFIVIGCFLFNVQLVMKNRRRDPDQLENFLRELQQQREASFLNEEKTWETRRLSPNSIIKIAIITCDKPGSNTSSNLASILIKSVLISAEIYHVPRVEFHIFLEDMEKTIFLKEYDFQNIMLKVKFHFHSVMAVIPKEFHDRLIYTKTHRCGFVRLFLSVSLV